MKKGLSYVDWSISVGLFIIYILTIFVLLGPAFSQDNSPEYLGSIVKTGIEENISLELNRIPAYVRLDTTGLVAGTYKFVLDDAPQEFLGVTDNMVTIYSDTTEIISKDLSYPQLSFDSSLATLNIFPDTGTVTSKVWVYVAPEEIFDDGVSVSSALTINNTFGVAEVLKGVYEPRFLDFSMNDYETAKEIIAYPIQKDFSITIYNETRLDEDSILNYTKAVPTEDDEVGVLMWSNWLISNDTSRTPITLLIKVW